MTRGNMKVWLRSAIGLALAAGWAVGASAQPANDECTAPPVLAPGSTVAVDTTGATGTDITTCAFQDALDVWYSFTAPVAGSYDFDTEGSVGIDTTLAIFDTCGGLQIACDDDSGTGLLSLITINLAAGQNVMVRAAGYNNTQGQFNLNASGGTPPPPPPANDSCDSAITVASLPFNTAIEAAGAADDVDIGCNDANGFSTRNGVWFTFTPSQVMRVRLAESGAVDVAIAIFTGPCASPTEINCTANESISAQLEAGVTYRFLVGAFAAAGIPRAPGVFNVDMTELPLGSNNECLNAYPLAPGASVVGDNLSADGSDISSCAFTDVNDVWYSFTTTAAGLYSFNTEGTVGMDTTLAAYDACDGTELACDDDSGTGLLSSINVNLAASQNIKVRVAGYNSTFGTFTLNASGGIPPATNDDCSAAIVLTNPSSTTGANAGATGTDLSSCAGAGDTLDVWYSFSPTVTGVYVFDTLGTSGLDTTLSIFDSCDGAEIACDDDSAGFPLSRIETVLSAGTAYKVRVAGYNGAQGVFTLNLSGGTPPPPPPANDACDAGTLVPSVPFSDTATVGGATSDIDVGCNDAARFDTSNGAWYTYTPNRDLSVRVSSLSASTPGFTTVAAVFSGSCSGLSELGCGTGAAGTIVALTSGTTYHILVGTFAGAPPISAQITLTISEVVPVTNDTCLTATLVTGSVSQNLDTTTAQNENDVIAGACNAAGAAGIDNSIWYTFTPGAGSLSGAIVSGGYDMVTVVFTGTCDGLTETYCSDNDNFDLSEVPLTPGLQHWIAIGDWGVTDGGGPTQVDITVPGGVVTGSCCISGACSVTEPGACSGTFTAGGVCTPNPCPAPTGACCANSSCSAMTQAACTGPRTRFAGASTVCNAAGNNLTPCCRADYNQDGQRGVGDLFDFLDQWFPRLPAAEIDGLPGVSVQDLFSYLDLWFLGC